MKPTFTLARKDISFSFHHGEVQEIQTRTEQDVNVSGGGGWITPYGGFVSGTTVTTTTNHINRLRIQFDDGTRSSVDVPGCVDVAVGDKVSLILAERGKKSQWCGLANHTTDSGWTFGDTHALIGGFPICGVLGSVGMFFMACVGAGLAGLAMAIVAYIFITAVLAHSLETPFSDTFYTVAFLSVVSAVIAIRRASKIEKSYKQLLDILLSFSLNQKTNNEPAKNAA